MTIYILSGLILVGTVWLVILLAGAVSRALRLNRDATKSRQKIVSRMREAELGPGGGPDHPIEISTPSLVESKASGFHCPYCQFEMRVDAHLATDHKGDRLRVAELQCTRCEYRRNMYFQIVKSN